MREEDAEDSEQTSYKTNEVDGLTLFLQDRPRFKLYSAGRHLYNLKSLEQKYTSIVSNEARIQAEIEIDCCLTEIIESVDALLVQINEKLDLGLGINETSFGTVQSGLTSKTKKIDLLIEIAAARQHGNWYWQLEELKQYSLHGSLLSKSITTTITSNPSTIHHLSQIYFKKDPRNPDLSLPMDLEIIPYLQQCLGKAEEVIERIRSKEPTLRSA
jgi:hypothetical protein